MGKECILEPETQHEVTVDLPGLSVVAHVQHQQCNRGSLHRHKDQVKGTFEHYQNANNKSDSGIYNAQILTNSLLFTY